MIFFFIMMGIPALGKMVFSKEQTPGSQQAITLSLTMMVKPQAFCNDHKYIYLTAILMAKHKTAVSPVLMELLQSWAKPSVLMQSSKLAGSTKYKVSEIMFWTSEIYLHRQVDVTSQKSDLVSDQWAWSVTGPTGLVARKAFCEDC